MRINRSRGRGAREVNKHRIRLTARKACRLSDVGTYLLAHFAKSQLWHASTLLFGFFLTEACGLEATAMGMVLAGSLIVNGVADAVLSRCCTSLPASLQHQRASAAVTCAFFLAFCATPLLEAGDRLVWAFVTILGFRLSYPFVDVPQNALVTLIADGPEARCSLLARRNIVSGLANLAVGLIAAPLLIHRCGTLVWLTWAGGVSLLVCGTAPVLRRLAVMCEDKQDVDAVPGGNAATQSPPIALLLGSLAVAMVAGSAFRSLEPYYAAFISKSAGLLVSAALGSMISQPLWAACRRRIGAGATLVVVAGLLLASAVMLAGPWRAERNVAVMIGLGFGAGTSGLWLMLWTALMAHTRADHAMGRVGTFTCVSKLSQGLAMVLMGQVLASSAYRTTLADAWSAPSLLMVAALIAIALAAMMLALGLTFGRGRISRTTSGGTPAQPRRGAWTVPVPDRRPS